MRKLNLVLAALAMAGLVANAEEDIFADGSRPKTGEACTGEGKKGEVGKHGRQNGMSMIERLRQSNPEKFEELKKLRKENPEEFKKQIRELAREMMDKARAEKDEINALVDKLKESGSEEDKAALKEKLKAITLTRIENGRKRIAQMEESIEKYKAQVEETEKNMDAKIEERIKSLLEKGAECGGCKGRGKGKEAKEEKGSI